MSATTVIIPCFNEADRLDQQRFSSFAEQSQDIHLLFVDDGSTDHTLQVTCELQRKHPERYQVQHLSQNVGKAEAVRLELLKALRHPSHVSSRPTINGIDFAGRRGFDRVERDVAT